MPSTRNGSVFAISLNGTQHPPPHAGCAHVRARMATWPHMCMCRFVIRMCIATCTATNSGTKILKESGGPATPHTALRPELALPLSSCRSPCTYFSQQPHRPNALVESTGGSGNRQGRHRGRSTARGMAQCSIRAASAAGRTIIGAIAGRLPLLAQAVAAQDVAWSA